MPRTSTASVERPGAPGDLTLPLWVQVARTIEAEVADLAAGTRLPSEAEQRRRFEVSRVTLRQALAHVQSKGLLESRAGSGWYVADGTLREPPPPAQTVYEQPGRIMSFTEMARSRRLKPDSVVLERSVHPAPFAEAEALAIAPGAEVLLLKRLRRLDGLAVAVDTSLVPLAVLPMAMSLDFSVVSLHDSFRAAGAAPATADTEVEAIVAGELHAKLLEVPEGFPLLNLQQAFYDATGRPIERAVITYRGDRYRYRSRLQA